ncbi:MAG: DUF1804 family protein [Methylotenera sp.]|nr:DUF1804 family protein [Methylotenera sp.]
MAHSQDTRNNVRRLYIEGLPLSNVSLTYEVSYETARNWKQLAKDKGDDWDTARAAFSISGAGIDDLNEQLVEYFARQAVTTMRELEDTKISPQQKTELMASLADAYAKFSKSFSRVNPRLGALSVSLDTLKTVAEYLARNDKVALHGFQIHIEDIGAILQERYGK